MEELFAVPGRAEVEEDAAPRRPVLAPVPTDLEHWLEELRLEPLRGRAAEETDAVREILAFVAENAHENRLGRMIIGLYLSFVSVAEGVLAAVGRSSSADPLGEFERVTTTARGSKAKTLTFVVDVGGRPTKIGIRGSYGAVGSVAYGRLRRYDYPSSSPHATQEWVNHQDRLQAVFAMSPGERAALARGLWQAVVDLPEHARRTEPRSGVSPFVTVLRGFAPAGRGIPTGAVLQGLTYAYMRADAPTLNFRVQKVRSGGQRDGRIGDIDGYYGPDVAQTAESKDRNLTSIDDVEEFVRNLSEWPDTIAFIVCRGADDAVVEAAAEQNITVITREQMADAARLWPVNKQMDGVRAAMEYYVHIEKKDALITAFQQYLDEHEIDLRRL
jgi:hypothetical protein